MNFGRHNFHDDLTLFGGPFEQRAGGGVFVVGRSSNRRHCGGRSRQHGVRIGRGGGSSRVGVLLEVDQPQFTRAGPLAFRTSLDDRFFRGLGFTVVRILAERFVEQPFGFNVVPHRRGLLAEVEQLIGTDESQATHFAQARRTDRRQRHAAVFADRGNEFRQVRVIVGGIDRGDVPLQIDRTTDDFGLDAELHLAGRSADADDDRIAIETERRSVLGEGFLHARRISGFHRPCDRAERGLRQHRPGLLAVEELLVFRIIDVDDEQTARVIGEDAE